MTDTSVVFNVIGKETGVSGTLGRIKGLFRSTGETAVVAMSAAERSVRQVDDAIDDARKSLRKLATDFALAGGAAEKLSIARQIKREQSELGKLTSIRKLLPEPEQAAPVGKSIGQVLAANIVKTATNLMDSKWQLLGAGAVAAAPLIGAAISGAVVGGIGIGGIAGGLALAAKRSDVKLAAGELGAEVSKSLDKGGAMFAGPAIAGIAKVRKAWSLFSGDLGRIFESSSKLVDPLIDRALSGALKIGHGIADAVSESGPAVVAIGNLFDRVGGSVGGFLTKLSRNSTEGAKALDDLTGATVRLIDTTGTLVGGLTRVYGAWSDVNNGFKKFTDGVSLLEAINPTAPLKLLYDGIKGVTGATDEGTHIAGQFTASVRTVGTASENTATQIAEQANQTRILALDTLKAHNANLSLYGSTTDVAEAFVIATKTIKENGKVHEVSTQKGRDNRKAIESVAGAIRTQYQNYVQLNGVGPQADAVAERLRQRFVKLATQAGYAAGAAEDLADELLGIPKSVDPKANLKAAKALEDARELRRAIDGIRSKTVRITVRASVRGAVDAVSAALAAAGRRAEGGPVKRGEAYVVGERRAEIFVPDRDGKIMPSLSQFTRGSGASDAPPMSSGGMVGRIEVVGEAAIVAFFRGLIRKYDLIGNAA